MGGRPIEDMIAAAEAAAGSMRVEADLLDSIVDEFGWLERRSATKLRQVADRLRLTADHLLAEAVAGDRENVGRLARVGQKVVAAGASISLMVMAGVATGASTVLVERHLAQAENSRLSLDRVEVISTIGDPSARYSVILTDPGDQKVKVIKLVREFTGHSLRESKDLIDTPPSIVIRDADLEVVMDFVQQLSEIGATAAYEPDVD